MMIKLGILTQLLVIWSLNVTAPSKVYYITTTPMDPPCHGPCLTLSQFAMNSSYLLYPNTTLIFLPGTHYLDTILILSNVVNFVMQSQNSTAHIVCISHSNLKSSHSNKIQITNLEFIGCGGNKIIGAVEFIVQDTKFVGQENNETALELIETTAQIVNTTFISNRKGSRRLCVQFVHPRCLCVRFIYIGGAIIATNSTIDINQSKFRNNRAEVGGAIFAEKQSNITMSGSLFINNSANPHGGVLLSYGSTVTIEASEFRYNSATFGGVIYSSNSTITIRASIFYDNAATWVGGVLESFTSSKITIERSKFHNNSAARFAGVLMSSMIVDVWPTNIAKRKLALCYTTGSTITIESSEFHNNTATSHGGVLFSSSSAITIGGSNFTNNSSPIGAVIYATSSSKIQCHKHILIDNNLASRHAVIFLQSSEFKEGNDSENFIFSSNLGSIMAYNSNITFLSSATLINNQSPKTSSHYYHQGGVMTLFQSNIVFDGICRFEYNKAENGGAIHSIESKIYVNGNVTLLYNAALRNGGGAYLLSSELNCQQNSTFILHNNTAVEKGGGVHAVGSSIKAASAFTWPQYTGTRINFTNNSAKRGGGLSLEANAKLYILKYDSITYYDIYHRLIGDTNTTVFTANSADYGGAVFVDDDSNSGSCASDYRTECFIQVLGHYDDYDGLDSRKVQCIYFSQNYANISGSTLYGGLLDRCSLNQAAEVNYMYYEKYYNGIGNAYFKNISIPTYELEKTRDVRTVSTTNLSIASGPVRVCFCINDGHNCTHQSYIEVKKGQTFTKSLTAIDQIGQPVDAIVESSLSFADSGLAEGQLARAIPPECTDLTFNIVSKHTSESLTLYASDGPCKDVEFSRATVEIRFLPCSCPIGLQESRMNETNCSCECHEDISQYVEHCDSHTGSLIKRPLSRAWISYINDTGLTGYLIYPNCPFDYCLSTTPPVYLNEPNGADAQCDFNRSSLLCGSCRPDLSLSLGSSRCLPCPSYWPSLLVAITIAAIIAGIAMVTLLLVLNVTVAVGTLNGLIFYANVVYTNKSILLPFQETNFVTVFISWLNLELGIDTCYFPGMDTYIKTWLQLAFPAYIILLVTLLIIISSYSTKFSNLIGKKDPVATLATLILLSYAKLLEICFKSLSFGVLKYPDGANELLWLPDATVRYLSGKHIPLFIAVVLILLVGLVYTALLFLWQCFIRLPKWRIFKWSRNPRIQTFIETYHTPYTPKHRYWTGLLLIVRVVLYLIAAVVSNESTIALTAIGFSVCSIFLLKGAVERRLYRKWPLNVLESFFFFNILFLTLFTWYFIDKVDAHLSQEAIAYTSVTSTVAVLLLIILYHMYTYTNTFSKIKKTKLGRMIDQLSVDADPKLADKRLRRWSPPPDDDIHRFDELLDELDCPVNTNDYNTTPLLRTAQLEPTFSAVEVSKPCDLMLQNPA